MWRSSDFKPLPARVADNLVVVLKSLPPPVLGPQIDEEAWWGDVQADPTLARKARRIREPERRPALGEIMRAPYWAWASCERLSVPFICGHKAPIALAPFLIRWGPDASSDLIRARLRCSQCGRLGCALTVPSWVDKNIEWQPYPIGRR
jgi:hypothetical protein